MTSISKHYDIEVLSISKNAASISYPDIVVLSFDIEESLSESARAAAVAPARHWTQIAVYTMNCASSVCIPLLLVVTVFHALPVPPSPSAPASPAGGVRTRARGGGRRRGGRSPGRGYDAEPRSLGLMGTSCHAASTRSSTTVPTSASSAAPTAFVPVGTKNACRAVLFQ